MAGSCRVPARGGVAGAPRVIFRKRSPLAVNISQAAEGNRRSPVADRLPVLGAGVFPRANVACVASPRLRRRVSWSRWMQPIHSLRSHSGC